MSRFRDAEEGDAANLPAGLERAGYDADSQTYYYRSQSGEFYRGEPGNRYGPMVPASAPAHMHLEDTVHDNSQAYRYFLPFLLLVIVFLLILIAPPWKPNFGFGSSVQCDAGSVRHNVKSGETCYELANEFSTTVAELQRLNKDVHCDNLQVGQTICVPHVDVVG